MKLAGLNSLLLDSSNPNKRVWKILPDLALIRANLFQIIALLTTNQPPEAFSGIKASIATLKPDWKPSEPMQNLFGTKSPYRYLATASEMMILLAEYLSSEPQNTSLLIAIEENITRRASSVRKAQEDFHRETKIIYSVLSGLLTHLREKKPLDSRDEKTLGPAAAGAGVAATAGAVGAGASAMPVAPPPSTGSPALFSKPMTDNWAIVRVWLPRDSEGNFITAHEATSGAGNVGHASLQTSTIYASFWPNRRPDEKGGLAKAILGTARGELIPEPWMDEYLESERKTDDDRNPPDVLVVLYSLNVDAINRAFKSFSESPVVYKWSLFGRNIFNVFNGGAGQSCSGLVYDLLNAGGIESIVKWDIVSKTWTVAPDAIARVAVMAAETTKEIELATRLPLPPGITSVIKKPDHSLDPHEWGIGSWLSGPGRA